MKTLCATILLVWLTAPALAQQKNSAALRAEGVRLLRAGKLEPALRKFDAALKINPRSSHSYFYRGLVHVRLRKRLAALKDFNHSISLNPNIPAAYIERGKIFLAVASLGQAFADFDLALQLAPTNGEAFFYRGKTFAVQHELDKAIADYTRALQLTPRAKMIHYQRGLAYLGLNKIALAEKEASALKPTRARWSAMLSEQIQVHRAARVAGLDLSSLHAVFEAGKRAWGWAPAARAKLDRKRLEQTGERLPAAVRASALGGLTIGSTRHYTKGTAKFNIVILLFKDAPSARQFLPFQQALLASRAEAYKKQDKLRQLGYVKPPAACDLGSGPEGWYSALKIGVNKEVFVSQSLTFVRGRWVIELGLMAHQQRNSPDLIELAKALIAELGRQKQ